jgi:predicted dehydrogenase
MGTRRLRDLSARGDLELALLETREDRRAIAKARFGVQSFASMEQALQWEPDALIVSTPPGTKHSFVEIALQNRLHFFCEADIWPFDYREVEKEGRTGIVAAPSCTFYFLPAIRELKRIVHEELGALHSYSFVLSTFEKSWHPDEGKEYYARHRITSPAREMVPFELIGLDYVFGEPLKAAGTVSTRGHAQMESEDTWCLQMSLDNGGTGQLSVMMASPVTMRKGWAVGSNGSIEFDLLTGEIKRQFPQRGCVDTLQCGSIGAVLESVYAQEINAFVEAARGTKPWPHSYYKSNMLAATLAAAERSSVTGMAHRVDPAFLPAQSPDVYEA